MPLDLCLFIDAPARFALVVFRAGRDLAALTLGSAPNVSRFGGKEDKGAGALAAWSCPLMLAS
eukprot:3156107-Pleurochrysis_carterae.AAC.1